MLDPKEITRLGATLRSAFDLSEVVEYTVESSPETLTEGKLDALLRVGMNRLSIGVQSFDEQELRRAARAHSSRQAEEAVVMAQACGCENINVDLITGFPGQDEEMLAHTLSRCVAIRPDHVTAYSYHAVPGTVMADQITLGYRPGITREAQLRAATQASRTLIDNGYVEYMPMYFTFQGLKPFGGERYYFGLRGDYFGFGSGAMSLIGHHRLANARGKLQQFLASPTSFDECVKFESSSFEGAGFLLRAPLFSREGIDRLVFRDRFGFDFDELRVNKSWRALELSVQRIGLRVVTTSSHVRLERLAEELPLAADS